MLDAVIDVLMSIGWNRDVCVSSVFILLFTLASVADILLFLTVSTDLSDFIGIGSGRSWQMVAIEVTCKVHYGVRQVYTALLLKSENVYRLTLSLLVSAPSNISSNADYPSAQIRKWNSVLRCFFI